MCTLTWFSNTEGYELFFNRDEIVTRQQAQIPTIQTLDGVSYISPTDTDAGGTWIAGNQFGVTVCLLNHYQFEQISTYKEWISRGEIVRSFAATRSLAQAKEEFELLELSEYRAFRMFMIDRLGNNALFIWDGHLARVEANVSSPKSSSSVDAMHVKSLRRELFEDLELSLSNDPQAYVDYHRSHYPEKSKESVCMHRPEASTVSLSRVSVNNQGLNFYYADGSPCTAKLNDPLSLKMVEVSSVSNAN